MQGFREMSLTLGFFVTALDIPPRYSSWSDYIARTTYAEKMKRCHAASKRANRVHRCVWPRDFSGADSTTKAWGDRIKGPCVRCGALPKTVCLDEVRLTGAAVWSLIVQAKGRCTYCGSLAVEGRPSHSVTGAPLSWEHIGRRIGSLEHVEPFLDGRINDLSNLRWACLWCNTWPSERTRLAVDHGGFYPTDGDTAAPVVLKPWRVSDELDDDVGFEMYPDHECPWDVSHAD